MDMIGGERGTTAATRTVDRAARMSTARERDGSDVRRGRVRVERLILHGLDNRAQQLRLVDDPALLSEEAQSFFALHVEAAASRADWRARFREAECEVAQHCQRLLGASDEFVEASQALAKRLYQTMRPLTIAPGDFVVLVYTRGDDPTRHIAMLKLDPDQRLARTFSTVAGRRRVRITAAENLLPDTTRLQKCALLRPETGPHPFEVFLLDTQAGPRAEGIATFFYDGFLTVRLAPSPRRLTRDFLRCTDVWLGQRRDELTPAQITDFYDARRSALREPALDLEAFAAAAVPQDQAQRAALVAHTREALHTSAESPQVDHLDVFPMDRSMADAVANRVTLELDGGARLTVPAERFADLVRIDPRRTGENKYRIVIESLTLREVHDR